MVYPKTVIQISNSLARCEIKLGELASHGRSIQAGSLCYNNRGAVDLIARLDALFSISKPEDRVFLHRHKDPDWRLRPVDARYRLEAYATLTGAWSMLVARSDAPSAPPDPEDRVFFTMGTKGLAWRVSAPWTLDTGWKPMLH